MFPTTSAGSRTAYHEAGHAVVARALSIPLITATIIRDRSSLGHVKIGKSIWQLHCMLQAAGGVIKHRADSEQTAWLAHIVILMAGREAEIALLGFHHDDKGDRQDKSHIRKLAKWLPYRTREETLQELRVKTRHIVTTFRNSIRRVAETLKRSETIDQRRIDQIIAASGEFLDPDDALGLRAITRRKTGKL